MQGTTEDMSDGSSRTTDLCNPSPEIPSDKIFPPLELRLNDYEAEVRFGVHVACHFLHFFNLLLDALIDALNQTVCWPSKQPSVLPISYCSRKRSGAYSNNSGADRSATQARVKACKSRLPRGAASKSGSASRRMSSMSMFIIWLGILSWHHSR